MHIPHCRRHRQRHCCCRGDVSLPHHHGSFFIIAVAVTVAFASVSIVTAIAAKAPQLSLPQSLTLGDPHPSAVIDDVVLLSSLFLSLFSTPLAPLMLLSMSTTSLVLFTPLRGGLGQTLDDINTKTLEDL